MYVILENLSITASAGTKSKFVRYTCNECKV